MLSKVKAMLGLKKEKPGRSKGIGGDSHSRAEPLCFDVTFTEKSLGLSLSARPADGMPEVVQVASGSPAAQAGVKAGYILTHLDGNAIESFDTFNSICGAIGRPVVLRFRNIEEGKVARGPTSASPRSGMSKEMQESRREAMIRAAEARERSWGKRVASASVARRKKEESTRLSDDKSEIHAPSNPETAKHVAAAKRSEENTSKALGYNPYVPVMSKGGSSTSSSSTSAEQAVSSTASSISEESLATEIREVAASIEELLLSQTIVEGGLLKSEECSTSEKYFWEVEECFDMLVSGSCEADNAGDRAKGLITCLSTAYKMLSNIFMRPEESKFQSIRVFNPNFQNKVATFPGGLELMLCAGFVIEERNDDDNEDEASRMYLRHSGPSDTTGMKCLRFILLRIRLLLLRNGVTV